MNRTAHEMLLCFKTQYESVAELMSPTAYLHAMIETYELVNSSLGQYTDEQVNQLLDSTLIAYYGR